MSARWSPDDSGQFKRLVIEHTDTGFASRLESAALNASSRLASGSIRSSLFAATDDAGLPDAPALSASVGICLFPQMGLESTAEAIIRCADQAMYQAKAAGKRRYHLAQ